MGEWILQCIEDLLFAVLGINGQEHQSSIGTAIMVLKLNGEYKTKQNKITFAIIMQGKEGEKNKALD